MSFGSGTGPPATEKQIGYLESLLRKAGHTNWSDARRALGLTAKQGRGKFTRTEASALIDRLTGGDDTPTATPAALDGPVFDGPVEVAGALAAVSPEELAAELRRRGWAVTPPPPPR